MHCAIFFSPDITFPSCVGTAWVQLTPPQLSAEPSWCAAPQNSAFFFFSFWADGLSKHVVLFKNIEEEVVTIGFIWWHATCKLSWCQTSQRLLFTFRKGNRECLLWIKATIWKKKTKVLPWRHPFISLDKPCNTDCAVSVGSAKRPITRPVKKSAAVWSLIEFLHTTAIPAALEAWNLTQSDIIH